MIMTLFLLSLLLAMKQLSPLDNLDFRVEVQETFQRKLRCLSAPEVQLIAYQSTSSASPALSAYSGNSQISLMDYTSTSAGRQRNATNPGTVVTQTEFSADTALAPRGSLIQTVMEGSSMYNTFYELENKP